MLFKVPDDFKGGFVLGSINKALRAGMSLSLTGNKLIYPDVKAAIKRGALVPVNKKEYAPYAKVSYEAMIVNCTDKTLVLEDVIIRPWGSRLVNKDVAETSAVITAEERGLIHVVSDAVKYDEEELQEKAKKMVQKAKAEVDETEPDDEIEEEDETKEDGKEDFIMGEDRVVEPKVWNFRDQKAEVAKTIPKTPDPIKLDEEEEPDVDFVDKEEEKETPKKKVVKKKVAKKKTKKKKTTKKKKATKKKAKKSKAKKKDTPPKTRTVKKTTKKGISPVGEQRPEKTALEADMDLDSRGRPVKKVSDELQHLIDSITGADIDFIDKDPNAPDGEISFVDEEQKQERIRRRQE